MEIPGAVLFDLDGTLVDSAPDISDAVALALAENGLESPGETAIRGFIGNGAARLVHRSITGRRDGKADQTAFDKVYEQFLAHYELRLFRRSAVYPGVVDTLEQLYRARWSLGCITNKPERFTLPLLRAASLAGYFSVVLSGDSLTQRKPDPAPIIHACERIRVPLDHAVMIGDSATDLTAAKRAGVRAICVSYGYAGNVDFAAHGADAMLDSMSELPATLSRMMS
jgi:phosphoglycolate phosphatase